MNAVLKSDLAHTDTASKAAEYDAWFLTPLGSLCSKLEGEVIIRLAGVMPNDKVLDLGCGTGFFTLELARRGAEVDGVDNSADMLEVAEAKAHREKLPVSFHKTKADILPFASQSFDLVVGITVLCFAERPDLILREAYRLLKDSGRIVIGELNRLSYWSWLRKAKSLFHESSYQHARFMSAAELKRLLWQTGYLVQESEIIIHFPPTNWTPVLKHHGLFDRTGKSLVPGLGAFMGMKAIKRPPGDGSNGGKNLSEPVFHRKTSQSKNEQGD